MNDILDMMIAAAKAGPDSATPPCGCHAAQVEEALVNEQIPIGEEGDFFEVEVPVVRCLQCGSGFTDARAEVLRRAAACKYRGLLSPEEIRAVRDGLRMSRREFDEAFGIPPASMERWENGKLLHNRSMDTLLRALANPSTAARLDRRRKAAPQIGDGNVIQMFPALAQQPEREREDTLARQKQFRLMA